MADNEKNNSVILHLSDLHFDGCENRRRDKLLTELVNTINSLDECWRPNVICITGDIVDKNSEDGYIKAAEWLEGFVSEFNISKQAIFVCPGNHDLDQSKAEFLIRPHDYSEADRVLNLPVARHYRELFEKYENFCENFGLLPYNFVGEGDYLVGIREYDGFKYVCINSCWCSMSKGDHNGIWLGINFIDAMDIPEVNSLEIPITIALMHHPRSSLAEPEREMYDDRPATHDYLAKRCHIILSGHTHSRPRDPHIYCYSAVNITGGGCGSGQIFSSWSLSRIDKESSRIFLMQFEWNRINNIWNKVNNNIYTMPIKDKVRQTDYVFSQRVESQISEELNREYTKEEIVKIYSEIYQQVTNLNYCQAIKIYNDNKIIIDRYREVYNDIICDIEILIDEAKNG